jgi:Na+-translocating ferredoxin:NAD+ oxidoreductase subunit A
LSGFFDLLSVALYTIFIQNLVFSGGYGASEAVRMAAKPRRFLLFACFIAYFSISTSFVSRTLDLIPAVNARGDAFHTFLFVLVLLAVYIVTALILLVFLGAEPKFLSLLGISALNTLVLAVPFINRRAAYTFTESLGAGLGAGLAFILAVALIGSGLQRLSQNKDIPKAFQGAPAMFIYVALLSLAFTGFSGGSLFA